MATFKTSRGRKVDHCHVRANAVPPCRPGEWTSAEKQRERAWLAAHYPNVVEVLEPSCKYNCFAYAYAQSHAWFNDPRRFIDDDFTQVLAGAQLGDVLVYRDATDFTHSAVVEELTQGEITKVRSKWGKSAVVTHHPTYVPIEFGEPVQLIRRKA